MPPKPKFTKEDILNTAFELAQEKGINGVVAREVGKKLGTSASPIFTFWNSMEDLQNDVKEKAFKLYCSYLSVANKFSPSFRKRGMQMIKFAQEQPKLFQLLFMNEQEPMSYHDLIGSFAPGFAKDLKIIQRVYGTTDEETMVIFNHIGVQAYGICVLCANKICSFSDKEVSDILGRSFAGMVLLVKSGKLKDITVSPALKNTAEGHIFEKPFTNSNQKE